jgi:hypothetical protein
MYETLIQSFFFRFIKLKLLFPIFRKILTLFTVMKHEDDNNWTSQRKILVSICGVKKVVTSHQRILHWGYFKSFEILQGLK